MQVPALSRSHFVKPYPGYGVATKQPAKPFSALGGLSPRFAANLTPEQYFEKLIYEPYTQSLPSQKTKLKPDGLIHKMTYKYAKGSEPETLSPWARQYLHTHKKQIILEAMKAYHLAQVDEFMGGLTGTHKGARVLVGNSRQEVWGGNNQTEFNRDLTWCVERGAFIHAKGEFIQNVDLSLYRDSTNIAKRADYREQLNRDIHAKAIVMSTNKLGEYVHVCAMCHNWLSSPRYFSPETMVISLRKENPEDPSELPQIYVQTLGSQLLRHWRPSLHATGAKINAHVDMQTLPLQYTPRARSVIPAVTQLETNPHLPASQRHEYQAIKSKIEGQLRNAMQMAQEEYKNNPCWELYKTQGYDHKNSGAAVVMTTGTIESAARFEKKRRYVYHPDDIAYATAYRNDWKMGNFDSRARAIAYVSDDPQFPTPYNLGTFMLNNIGSEDTLIVTLQTDKQNQPYIEVASARDYLPQTMQPDTAYRPSVPPWLTDNGEEDA